uniref:Uncharacterized protein n=1 Tax=Rhizophora mucronata TaxID=61149 RepID=A0A2P2QZA0_RHIMU
MSSGKMKMFFLFSIFSSGKMTM